MTINVETDEATNSELYALRRRMVALEQMLAERERVEAELRASEERYRLLAENSVDLFSRHAADGVYLYVSPACESILGYTQAELIGRSAYDLLHPDELNKILAAHAEALTLSERTVGTCRTRHKDGHYIWLETSYRTLRDPQTNDVLEMQCVSRDVTERKQADAALQASEQKLSLHVQQTPLAYIEWNAAFEVVEWNPAAERIFGYSRAETLGRHGVGLLVVEAARAPLMQAWQDLLQQQGGARSLYRNITKDGRSITCEWYNTPLVNAAGDVLGVVSLVQDVTERQQTEAALRESEARFQRITANVPGVVYQFVLHPDGSIEWPFISEGCRELFGVEPEYIQRNRTLLQDIIAPEDRPRFDQALAESARTLAPWKWDGVVILSSGARKSLQCVSRPERQANGAIRWDGLAIDTTARMQAEAAQRASEERLNSILQTLDDVVWSVDATTSQLVYISHAAEHLYGYSVEQLRANPRLLLDTVHPDDRAQYDQYTPQLLTHGSIDVEYRIRRPDGGISHVHDRGWVIRDEHGRPVTINGIVSDITRRVETEAESKRLQAEIIEMQAAMLAELSTPLIPLNDQIVVMPLVGALDSQRVQRVLDSLLDGVSSSRARIAILDITGVPIVDTQIANTLIRAAQAVKLLGANVVLTGIRPEVAQTLVGLGVDLRQIVTCSSLQSGIAYATRAIGISQRG